MALASTELINNTKNISSNFLPTILNLNSNNNKKNKFLASNSFDTFEQTSKKSLDLFAKKLSNNIEQTTSEKLNNSSNNSHKSTRENTPYNNDNSSTTICQRRHLLSPTTSSTVICLCVSCLLSSKSSSSFNENTSAILINQHTNSIHEINESDNNRLFTSPTT